MAINVCTPSFQVICLREIQFDHYDIKAHEICIRGTKTMLSAFSVAFLFAEFLFLCLETHCYIFFLMPVAQRLPSDLVHQFESSEGKQGHYANALDAGKREELC